MQIELTERQQEILLPGRRGVRGDGAARGLEGPRRAIRRCRSRPSTVRQRARRARAASGCSRIRTRPPAGCRPTTATATTRGRLLERLEPRPSLVPARSLRGPQRGRGGAPGDDRDALAGDASARARLGAAARRRRRSVTSRCSCCSRDVVMVVVITSAGAVTKRVFAFDAPVDPGSRAGPAVPERAARRRPARARGCSGSGSTIPASSPVERDFVERAAAGVHRARRRRRAATVRRRRRRAPRRRARRRGHGAYRGLLELLERRRALLDVLAEALDPRRPFVRVGDEFGHPALHELALVGAAYGLSNRTLGRRHAASGRSRMDYDKAIRSVRAAASELSRFSEESSARTRPAGRSRDDERDYYEVLGVARDASDARDQEGVPAARPRAAPGRLGRARRGGALQGGRRGLRGALELRAAGGLRPLRARGAATAAASRRRFDVGNLSDLFSAFFGDDLFGVGGGAPGAAPTSARRSRSSSSRLPAASRRSVPFEVAVPCADLRGQRRRARNEPGHVRACGGAGRLQQVSRSVFGEFVRTQTVPALRRLGESRRDAVQDSAAAAAASSRSARSTSRSRPAFTTASASGSRARGTRARSAARPATSTSSSTSSQIRASFARATTSSPTVDLTDDRSGPRHPRDGADARRRRRARRSSPARSPARCTCSTGAGCRSSRASGRGDHRVLVNVTVPRRLTDEQRRAARGLRRGRPTSETYVADDGLLPAPEERVPLRRPESVRSGASRSPFPAAAPRRRARRCSSSSRTASRRSTTGTTSSSRRTPTRRARSVSGTRSAGRTRLTSTPAGRIAGATSTGRCRIGPLWVGPPWEAAPTDATAVVIDPGRAFGTGGHATTRLCLELLARPSTRVAARRRLRLGRARDRGGQARLRARRRRRRRPARGRGDAGERVGERRRRSRHGSSTRLESRFLPPQPSSPTSRSTPCRRSPPRSSASGSSRPATSSRTSLHCPATRGVRRRDAEGWAADLWEAASK